MNLCPHGWPEAKCRQCLTLNGLDERDKLDNTAPVERLEHLPAEANYRMSTPRKRRMSDAKQNGISWRDKKLKQANHSIRCVYWENNGRCNCGAVK